MIRDAHGIRTTSPIARRPSCGTDSETRSGGGLGEGAGAGLRWSSCAGLGLASRLRVDRAGRQDEQDAYPVHRAVNEGRSARGGTGLVLRDTGTAAPTHRSAISSPHVDAGDHMRARAAATVEGAYWIESRASIDGWWAVVWPWPVWSRSRKTHYQDPGVTVPFMCATKREAIDWARLSR